MRISDWSSDVCSSDLDVLRPDQERLQADCRQHAFVLDDADPAIAPRELVDERIEVGLMRVEEQDAGADIGRREMGRAAGRGRVWQTVLISEEAVSLKKRSTIGYYKVYTEKKRR